MDNSGSDQYQLTSLQQTIINNDLPGVVHELETLSHEDKLRTCRDGWTALHYAAYNGNTAIVEKLLKSTLPPSDQNAGTSVHSDSTELTDGASRRSSADDSSAGHLNHGGLLPAHIPASYLPHPLPGNPYTAMTQDPQVSMQLLQQYYQLQQLGPLPLAGHHPPIMPYTPQAPASPASMCSTELEAARQEQQQQEPGNAATVEDSSEDSGNGEQIRQRGSFVIMHARPGAPGQ